MIHTQPPRRPDATAQQPYDLKMLLSNVDSLLPNGYLAIYFNLAKPRPPPNSGIYDGRGQSKLALPGNNTQWSVGVLECWSSGVLE